MHFPQGVQTPADTKISKSPVSHVFIKHCPGVRRKGVWNSADRSPPPPSPNVWSLGTEDRGACASFQMRMHNINPGVLGAAATAREVLRRHTVTLVSVICDRPAASPSRLRTHVAQHHRIGATPPPPPPPPLSPSEADARFANTPTRLEEGMAPLSYNRALWGMREAAAWPDARRAKGWAIGRVV